MAFEDLGDWAELTGLRLPIGGKTYALPPVGSALGIRIVAIMELGSDLANGNEPNTADTELLSDGDERALYQEILGPVFAEMLADGVPWAALKHAAMTAMIDVVYDRERAERYWATRLGKTTPAKKPAKKPTDRRPRKATATRTSTASTAGTTQSRARKKAAAPRGRRSSPSGA